MILFYQLKTQEHVRGGTEKEGLIIEATNLDAFKGLLNEAILRDYFLGEPAFKSFAGNVVDLETGEIYSERSKFALPEWVRNPLLRALKLAEYKQKPTTKRRKKTQHENTKLHRTAR